MRKSKTESDLYFIFILIILIKVFQRLYTLYCFDFILMAIKTLISLVENMFLSWQLTFGLQDWTILIKLITTKSQTVQSSIWCWSIFFYLLIYYFLKNTFMFIFYFDIEEKLLSTKIAGHSAFVGAAANTPFLQTDIPPNYVQWIVSRCLELCKNVQNRSLHLFACRLSTCGSLLSKLLTTNPSGCS